MSDGEIRRATGRFADDALEREYRAFAWPTIRMQTGLTIGGLSLGLLAAFILVDLAYAPGTPSAATLYAGRLGPALAGLTCAGWLLLARPGWTRPVARFAAPAWILVFLAGLLIVAFSYPLFETTPEGHSRLLVFTSYWMSIMCIVVGFGLYAYPAAVTAFSAGMALGYVTLAAIWSASAAFPPVAQAILMVMAAAFAAIMAVVANIRARRVFLLTRLYERARDSAEASQALYAFLLGAAVHDVKQPVFAMKLNADVLARNASAGDLEAVRRHAERQGAMAQGVNRLLSSILELTARDEAEAVARSVEAGALFEEIAQTWRSAAEAGGSALRIVGSSKAVKVHPGAVRHILGNAVSNAIDHGRGGRVLIGLRRAGSRLVIEVHNDGPGLAGDAVELTSMADVLDRAPESRSGSGLGLGIMFRLAEREGLPLLLRSRPGRGVRIRLLCEPG